MLKIHSELFIICYLLLFTNQPSTIILIHNIYCNNRNISLLLILKINQERMWCQFQEMWQITALESVTSIVPGYNLIYFGQCTIKMITYSITLNLMFLIALQITFKLSHYCSVNCRKLSFVLEMLISMNFFFIVVLDM